MSDNNDDQDDIAAQNCHALTQGQVETLGRFKPWTSSEGIRLECKSCWERTALSWRIVAVINEALTHQCPPRP